MKIISEIFEIVLTEIKINNIINCVVKQYIVIWVGGRVAKGDRL